MVSGKRNGYKSRNSRNRSVSRIIQISFRIKYLLRESSKKGICSLKCKIWLPTLGGYPVQNLILNLLALFRSVVLQMFGGLMAILAPPDGTPNDMSRQRRTTTARPASLRSEVTPRYLVGSVVSFIQPIVDRLAFMNRIALFRSAGFRA